MANARPRRSILFMPASNARALEKAKSLPADGLIFDLEDAVAPTAKAEARMQAAAAVASGDYGGRDLVVRINGLDTDWWRDDLKAVVPNHPFAILIPKVESPDAIHRVEEEITWHAANPDMEIWAMIETPKGFLNAGEIAGASDRLTTWIVGANDLVKDLRAKHTRDRLPVITALGLALLHARANGLTILDSVYGNFSDEEGFAFECGQAKEMGFDGKTLIHPAQVDVANRIFAPSEEELTLARRMLAAFEEAKAEGKGVAVLDGRMVEELHLEEARRMVAMAEAIAG
ncbi:HpcH/HpaI aldolase/citrate lyase family protein [Kordiimonas lipolytica]|uniref:HpcH/HpaI aldolase/citrate lyase family protein n=1 Tax=Kordiimonas lipolytica TaxID=1662421 RepID=A0ABV8UFX5_9PROT|nr:CoA ester lyase [Kordiimonas lipolytica]